MAGAANHSVGFRWASLTVPGTSMGANRRSKVIGPTIVEEEYPLAKTPQRRCSEFVTRRVALPDSIRQARTHGVKSKIGI